MKSKIRAKLSPLNGISLLALLLFTNSILFAQVKEKAQKGDKHIKIEAEVDGKKINVDTIIPAGSDFDYAAFMKSLGLEGHMEDLEDENSFTYEYETEDGTKKEIRKEVRVEVEADGNGEKQVTKTIIMHDGDDKGEHKKMIKKLGDGDEKVIIIKDGEVVDSDKDVKIIKKQLDGDDVMIIEEEAEDGTITKTKIWIDEKGQKHKIKGDQKVIIITDDEDDKKKKKKKDK